MYKVGNKFKVLEDFENRAVKYKVGDSMIISSIQEHGDGYTSYAVSTTATERNVFLAINEIPHGVLQPLSGYNLEHGEYGSYITYDGKRLDLNAILAHLRGENE